jgi:recombination protein RecR
MAGSGSTKQQRVNRSGKHEDKLSKFAEPMARLIDELKKLPSIGGKTAQRLAFHILRSSDEDAELLSEAIRQVKASLHLCSVCSNITDIDPCVYCSSATRNQRLVCVVEEPTNIAAIEKTRSYNGVYHVLHGALSPLHGIAPEHLRLTSLSRRVERGDVDELIIATNPTVEGEATAVYISRMLKAFPVKLTRIATGIPAGSDIEYADEVTMAKALEGRRAL